MNARCCTAISALALAPTLACAAPPGTFQPTPNYVGSASDSTTVTVEGTPRAPAATAGAAAVVEKSSGAGAFNAFAGLAWKTSAKPDARATGIYGEAVDVSGGLTSFVEGGRFQGTLAAGTGGSAYGLVCAAGTDRHGAGAAAYLVGCEGTTLNSVGPAAPPFSSINYNAFSAAFVATNGAGPGHWFSADAGFATNHFSASPFRTGFLVQANSVDDTGFAIAAGAALRVGIDVHLATLAQSALWMPNGVGIVGENAAGTRALSLLAIDGADNLQIGGGITTQAVFAAKVRFAGGWAGPDAKASLDAAGNIAGQTVRLQPTTFSALPPCNAATAGTLAYVHDAAVAITAWHQAVTAGGGANSAFIACNGRGWFAFDD